MIKISCRTNLDNFERVEWPTVLCMPPQIGHCIEGRRGNQSPTLRIVGITHAIDRDGSPYLQVEMHR